jgi:hypothetical protein
MKIDKIETRKRPNEINRSVPIETESRISEP